MALRVADLDRAVAFAAEILALRQTERTNGAAYLTCNERHHELILMRGSERSYDHVGLEVADAAALERAHRILAQAGVAVRDGGDSEPGIERSLRFTGPGGHQFKLFCGMQHVEAAAEQNGPERPLSFEHLGLKVRNTRAMEALLDRLGLRCSDRMGRLASWYRCDEHHHGIGVTLGPSNQLHHLAWGWPDLDALGRIADRLSKRGETLVWGPGRHGPGNNLFTYFFDPDGFMIECCADLALVGPGHEYVPSYWSSGPDTISRWGSRPPLRFLRTGVPPARSPR
jgi:catechol 2,3-dioxygenase-like lactoylglutathione lyase family enzyme